MDRLVIRVEGSAPDFRILVRCGGPGKRTSYSTRKADSAKGAKEAVRAAVEEARELVASRRV